MSVAIRSRESRNGMWSLCAISGQNSRRTSKPMPVGIATYPQGGTNPAFVPRMVGVIESDSGRGSQPL